MKKLTVLLATLAITGVLANAADDNNTRAQRRNQNQERGAAGDLDRHIQAVNRLDKNQAALRAGMAAVSKETAVPLNTIEAEHKDHPQMGLAGLFVAHQLSVTTHKPADQFIKQRQSGQSWAQIARANNQDLADLDQKLTRIEEAMRNPGAASSTAGTTTSTADKTQVREATPAPTALENRIAALNTLDDKPLVMRTGLQALSKETATPLPQLEELQKQQTTAGIGDLFMAQEIAVRTHKTPDELLKAHTGGKTWEQIITENNQDRGTIEQKLSRVEQAMRDADKQ